MSLTLPDIILTQASYTNLYTASGITAGASIAVQNKSSSPIHVQVRATQPPASSRDGTVIDSLQQIVVVGTPIPGVWAIGAGPIAVQENS